MRAPVNLPLGPLMVDVGGLELSREDIELLLRPAVGAVILFRRNFASREQVTTLIRCIKAIRNPALLIAVDQEGGRVQRFKKGFSSLPAALDFGRMYDRDRDQALALCRETGSLMARELIEVGVDFSFAPVLDRANSASGVIGDRGFHQRPQVIAELAGAFVSGMNSAGMVATGKHFPGHGGVVEDSHTELPVDNRTLQELEDCDLLPWRNLIGRLGGTMTAHVHFPNIDDELPTYSSFWIQSILRQRLRFKGLIFSDDLSMKGAEGAGAPLRRTQRALQAGCDMALICNDRPAANEVARKLEMPGPGARDPLKANLFETMRASSPCTADSSTTITLCNDRRDAGRSDMTG